jgi:PPOX class F420-dependent enzyme/OxyR family protein
VKPAAIEEQLEQLASDRALFGRPVQPRQYTCTMGAEDRSTGGRSVMSVFSAAEIKYLESQRLARIATAGRDCQPHVVPVAFRYNPETDTIDVGGHGFAQRKKYRDVHSNPRAAIVIDDLASADPWRPRMIGSVVRWRSCRRAAIPSHAASIRPCSASDRNGSSASASKARKHLA